MFSYEKEIDAAYGIILYSANKVSEQLHSHFRVVKKLHQDVILGFDWLQNINPKVNWVNYGITLKYGFAAAGVLIYSIIKVELYSFKVFIYLLLANKLANI